MNDLEPIKPGGRGLRPAAGPVLGGALLPVAGLADAGLILILFATGHWLLAPALTVLSGIAAFAVALARKGAADAARPLDPGEELVRAFNRYKYSTGTEAFGEQAVAQYEQTARKYKAFGELLRARLEPSELTYNRFLGIAESARRTLLGQLQGVREGLDALAAAQPGNTALLESHRKRIAETLALNEAALGEFDRAIAALTEVKTGAMTSNADLSAVIQDLEQIASRAKNLANRDST